jgi:hypothetical protein
MNSEIMYEDEITIMLADFAPALGLICGDVLLLASTNNVATALQIVAYSVSIVAGLYSIWKTKKKKK